MNKRSVFLDPKRLSKMLVLERDGAVVGDMMLAIRDAWAQTEIADQARGVQAELGWVVDPTHAGQGLTTEAGVPCCASASKTSASVG